MEDNLLKAIKSTDFEKLFKNKKYSFFVNGDYNLNIIGIRNMSSNIQRDTFNDFLVIMYKVDGQWKKEIFECTTDPSLKFLKSPINSKGCAILVPGQYKSTWQVGLHKGKYKALVQTGGPVNVYRDSNKDNKLDFNPKTIQNGFFGINIHRASAYYDSDLINGYSAGCQVFKHVSDFDKFMKIVEKSKSKYGNKFTYTLVTSDML